MAKFEKMKRALSAIAASAVLLSSQPVLGFEISYDGGETDLCVKGSTTVKKGGQIITLKVTDEQGDLIYTRQTETKADGTYEFVFSLDYNGKVTAVVSENGELTQPKAIYKSVESEVDAVLAKLNGAEEISAVITADADVLLIDLAEYNTVSASGLLNKLLDAQTYDSIADFKSAYSVAKFLVAVEKADTSLKILNEEQNNKDVLAATDTKAYKVYELYNDNEKQAVLSKLCGKRFELGIAEYAKARDGAIVVNEISKATNYNEKYELLEEYNDVLGLDLDKYSDLDKKFEDFKKKLFEENIDTVEKLAEAAESVYDDLTDGEKTYGNGGGGGGGGSTSNFKVNDNLITTNPIPQIQQFNDLGEYEWAKTAITVLAAKTVVNGKAEGIFAPADTVTRAEFIKMLAGAFSLMGSSDINFADVPKGHWSYEYIAAAVANKIANGLSETEFGANEKITRQDMAVFCNRIIELKELNIKGDDVSFSDEDKIAPYASESVKALARAGIINGTGDGNFAPENNATRAEAAVIIYRLSEYCSGR
ncbi:MAG: S-layer homology domain-containing protein [Clostridia bacterium]|nr:S-layer homology domain-containing protein [Clostridia bacterium]